MGAEYDEGFRPQFDPTGLIHQSKIAIGDRVSLWVNEKHKFTMTVAALRSDVTLDGLRRYITGAQVHCYGRAMTFLDGTEMRLWNHYGDVQVTRGTDAEAMVPWDVEAGRIVKVNR